MALKNLKFIFLIVIISISLSCNYIDIAGLFNSSFVDQRFAEKNDLKNFSSPDVSDDTNFNFLIISDTHYYLTQPNYIKEIEQNRKDWGISFIIILGDIVQNGYKDAFNLAKDDFENSKIPIYPIIGNHDLYNNGWNNYKKIMGRSVYAFEINNTYFIFLDTANGTIGNLQKSWLEKRLSKSNHDNILIFSHYSPTDQEWQSLVEWSFPEERYYLIDLLDRYNVDFMFCGHLHNNDIKEIRGVKYQVIKNISSNENDVYLKVSINGNKISTKLF